MAAPSNEDEQHGTSVPGVPVVSTNKAAIIIPPKAKKLLEEYSNIAPDEVTKHVTSVVNTAPFVSCLATATTIIFPLT